MLMQVLAQDVGSWFFCFMVLVGAGLILVAAVRPSKRRCPRCAQINPPHARYCAHCGCGTGFPAG